MRWDGDFAGLYSHSGVRICLGRWCEARSAFFVDLHACVVWLFWREEGVLWFGDQVEVACLISGLVEGGFLELCFCFCEGFRSALQRCRGRHLVEECSNAYLILGSRRVVCLQEIADGGWEGFEFRRRK